MFRNVRSEWILFPIIQSYCISWAWTLKPFSPQRKKDFKSSYGLKLVDEATRKLIFPTPDLFLAEAKKVLASPGLWGKLGFLPGSFFSLKEKDSDLSQILS